MAEAGIASAAAPAGTSPPPVPAVAAPSPVPGPAPAPAPVAAGAVEPKLPDAAILEAPKPEEKAAEPAKPTEPVAVEYKDFVLPEGIKADDPVMKAFQEHAGKLGISQDNAQKIVAEVGKLITDQARKPFDVWAETRNGWQAEVKADKELGGQNFDVMRQTVAAAFDVYVGPPSSDARKTFNDALTATGAGDNPHIIRAFSRMSKALSEGTPVSGNPATGAADRDRKALAALYPSATPREPAAA